MPRVIGLTGNIACGKTTVGHMLLELGAERYIDADAIVHHLYDGGQPVAKQVVKAFGPIILAADGSIDRKALGARVFQDAEAMRCLERIVHPAVAIAVMNELTAVSENGIAIIDAVKLLEGGSAKLCRSKWLVVCSEEQELARLLARSSMTKQEALARLHAQPSISARLPLVDEVIDNSGSLEQTRRQVIRAFERFCTC
ncbi:MAG: dephospho-CoA kinase [Ktedonobacteraceae bacterium]|nr:dephospho-CoA kinase [Ktedonobacteraceae bacterium]